MLDIVADFTPVCTTELGAMAQYADKFAQRGVKLLGFSCDDVQSHKEWIKDIEAFNVLYLLFSYNQFYYAWHRNYFNGFFLFNGLYVFTIFCKKKKMLHKLNNVAHSFQHTKVSSTYGLSFARSCKY